LNFPVDEAVLRPSPEIARIYFFTAAAGVGVAKCGNEHF